SHSLLYTLSLHDALPISYFTVFYNFAGKHISISKLKRYVSALITKWLATCLMNMQIAVQFASKASKFANDIRIPEGRETFKMRRSEEHTSELQSLRHLVC